MLELEFLGLSLPVFGGHQRLGGDERERESERLRL